MNPILKRSLYDVIIRILRVHSDGDSCLSKH